MYCSTKRNIFFICYSTDLSRIQKVISQAVKENKKIAILGRKGEQIVNIAIKTNYLEIPSENIIELNGQEIENTVVFIVGTANEPYNILKRIILGNDKRVKATTEDTIITLSDPISGCEKNVLNVLDIAARNDYTIKNISKKKKYQEISNIRDFYYKQHATQDDLSQLYSMINPKYFIPIKGEERHIDRHQKLLQSLNYSKDNIFTLYDGNVVVFEDGKYGKLNNLTINSCSNLMNNPDFIFNWLSSKTQIQRANLSLDLQGIDWTFDMNNFNKLFLLESVGTSELSTRNIRGNIKINANLDISSVIRLQRIFGNDCFKEGSTVYIKAPTALYVNLPETISILTFSTN